MLRENFRGLWSGKDIKPTDREIERWSEEKTGREVMELKKDKNRERDRQTDRQRE